MKFFKMAAPKNWRSFDFTNHSKNSMECQCAGCNAYVQAIEKLRKK